MTRHVTVMREPLRRGRAAALCCRALARACVVFGAAPPAALASHQPLDLLVMPGLGFDLEGRRLGRGGG